MPSPPPPKPPALNFQTVRSHLLKLQLEEETLTDMILNLEDVASHFGIELEIGSSCAEAKELEGLVKKVVAKSGGNMTYDEETQLIEIHLEDNEE